MMKDELRKILKKHTLWLTGKDGGKRADLSGAELSGAILFDADLSNAELSRANLYEADLSNADLSNADLCGTNLRGAGLVGAILRGADLRGADLSGANLCGANLCDADLFRANLRGADLEETDLSEANLCSANLCSANLDGAKLKGTRLCGANFHWASLGGAEIDTKYINEETSFICPLCPEEGAFVGYKKAREKIVVLEIPADAKRSSATTYKCRCSKAKVLRIENLDGTPSDVQSVASDYDKDFVYKVEEIVEVKDFGENRWVECSRGIHFFISKEMARHYQ